MTDQSGRDQEFEDVYRSSLASLRRFAREHDLTYAIYAALKAKGREWLTQEFTSIAARGQDGVSPLEDAHWLQQYKQYLDSPAPQNKVEGPISGD